MLMPLPPAVRLSDEQIQARIHQGGVLNQHRVEISSIPIEDRVHNFREVDLTLTEAEALAEAGRCLRCADCSECLECQAACTRGAIDHEMHASQQSLDVSAIIWAEDVLPTLEPSEDQRVYRIPAQNALLGSMAAARALSVLIDGRQASSTPQTLKSTVTAGRTGVFICQCGGTISRVIDTRFVRQQAAQLPNVTYAQELPFSCSPDASQVICAAVEAHHLNRLVLAGCTCCPMDQVCYSCTYQRVRCKSNLGLFAPLAANAANSRRCSAICQAGVCEHPRAVRPGPC